uniref:PH01B001E05.7 protein n=1 Tax=Phyllostachys edulis TaxID=38705 RepID=L0P1V1_PHYED|nr:PH01B001E05.7 [Phyllostachys edulis]
MGVGKECDNRCDMSTAKVGAFNVIQHALNAVETSLPKDLVKGKGTGSVTAKWGSQDPQRRSCKDLEEIYKEEVWTVKISKGEVLTVQIYKEEDQTVQCKLDDSQSIEMQIGKEEVLEDPGRSGRTQGGPIKDVRNLFQLTIMKIIAKVLTFIRFSEGCFTTEPNTKTVIEMISWEESIQDG